ncbi:hypothetical protein MHK_008052 [Candidatus Magnetomorum sp. HK-1]|nr:hypothetical protein MHK_008052 [Candidatus Magnetomorum sp. HK-1]
MKSELLQELKYEFNEGLLAAQDPENAYLPPLSCLKTTRYSAWFTRKCPECGLDFREGDMVKLCPKCKQAYHNDDYYHLNCWDRHFSNGKPCRESSYDRFNDKNDPGCSYKFGGTVDESDNDSKSTDFDTIHIPEINKQFMNGLAVHWKSFDNLLEQKVSPHDPKIGEICQWCGSSIRPGDRLVKCPCGKCETYFHNDMYRQLSCWNEWNKSKKRDYCIQSGRKIVGEDVR